MIRFQRTFSLLRLLSAIAAFALGWPGVTEAAPIQFKITGTIDVQFQVGPLPQGIFQGAPFQAILSYELATPDSRPDDPKRGFYSTTSSENNYLLIRAGESEIRSIGPLSLFVGNDLDSTLEIFELPDDTFGLRDVEFSGNFEHSSFALMAFRWNDPTRSAFSSDALPVALDSAAFEGPFIDVRTIQFDPRVNQFSFRANVDSISLVPEPTSLFGSLMAIAFFAIAARRFL